MTYKQITHAPYNLKLHKLHMQHGPFTMKRFGKTNLKPQNGVNLVALSSFKVKGKWFLFETLNSEPQDLNFKDIFQNCLAIMMDCPQA